MYMYAAVLCLYLILHDAETPLSSQTHTMPLNLFFFM